VLGQKSGPEGRGIDIVEAHLDIKNEGGDPASGPLKRPNLVGEAEDCVVGTESWEGGSLVWVEQTLEASDCGQPDHHYLFDDL